MDDAWAMGFDHIALCMGAGKPTVLDIPNGLARGVRAASDFLMALQLTGAAKLSSITNLQLRLPVVVIGGGLTAIDTATESLAYYVRQVEKFAARFHTLAAERGEAAVRAGWNAEEAGIANEFLGHAAAIEAERVTAAREGRAPRLGQLLDQWGGVTIAYRRRLIDSPSYTLNHEEVAKALEEAVRFAEGLTPRAVEVDEFGHPRVCALPRADGTEVVLPARAILVAAGTQPNTVLAREDGRIKLDGRYFQAVDATGASVGVVRGLAKPDATQVLMHRADNGRFVSFFGDLHPSFFGNVVKAMGGAKRGYPVVSGALDAQEATGVTGAELIAHCRRELVPRVHAVHRLTPTIVEVVVHAPAQARAFRPGQFYRLQNYEMLAPRIAEAGAPSTVLAMEGLAMTGAWTDPVQGLVSVIVLEMGGSSDVCALLKPGEPVVLMGPTGTPTEIHAGATVALIGGGLGNAVLFSIGAALRSAGSRVIYFAGYKQMRDRYKVAEIERAADVIVWCCDEAPGFVPTRPQDRSLVGNIVQGMAAYRRRCRWAGGRGPHDRHRIGPYDAGGRCRAARRSGAAAEAGHTAIGSINSPMQCMMKEVCAQCLQPQVDPASGERRVRVLLLQPGPGDGPGGFSALHERLAQNGVQEKLTAQWIDRALHRLHARGVSV